MSEKQRGRLRVGDPVRLKDSDIDLRGDVWQLHTGCYLVVRWQDDCCSTHSEAAVEYDASRSRAEWSRHASHEDRKLAGDQWPLVPGRFPDRAPEKL